MLLHDATYNKQAWTKKCSGWLTGAVVSGGFRCLSLFWQDDAKHLLDQSVNAGQRRPQVLDLAAVRQHVVRGARVFQVEARRHDHRTGFGLELLLLPAEF